MGTRGENIIVLVAHRIMKLDFNSNFGKMVKNLIAKWQPGKMMEGWVGVLHGGIQASLVDELAGWIVMIKMKTSGVTSDLNVKYLKPVYISKGIITVKGRIISQKTKWPKLNVPCSMENNIECLKAK